MKTSEHDLRVFSERGHGAGTVHRPAVPRPAWNWKTRVLLPAALLGGFTVLLGFSARDVLLPAREVEVVPVVVKATEGSTPTGAVVVQAPGWIEADPFSISVSALSDGVVKEVLVLEGDRVAAGQVVARLVEDDARLALTAAEAETALRRASLLSAEATLRAAEQEWEHPIERRRSLETAEAMRAEMRAELDRLPAEIAAEQALLVELHAEHERVGQVYESHSAAAIELIRAQQRCEAQSARLKLIEGRRPILEAKIRQLDAEVTAAQENLRLRISETRVLADAKAGLARAQAELQRAEAMRDEARLRLERMSVRSPVDGVVQSRLIEPGSKLSLSMDDPRSAQAIRLYDPEKLQVRVDVPLADSARIGVGQKAQVSVDALPDRVFEGVVTRVVHEADVQKNTVQFKVAILRPAAELKPEMLARAKFLGKTDPEGETGTSSVFAPASLVRGSPGGPDRVWLVDQGKGLAVSREVTAGPARMGGWVEVRQGLQPGDRLIVGDPAGLREGTRVRVIREIGGDDARLSGGNLHGSH